MSSHYAEHWGGGFKWGEVKMEVALRRSYGRVKKKERHWPDKRPLSWTSPVLLSVHTVMCNCRLLHTHDAHLKSVSEYWCNIYHLFLSSSQMPKQTGMGIISSFIIHNYIYITVLMTGTLCIQECTLFLNKMGGILREFIRVHVNMSSVNLYLNYVLSMISMI